MAGRMVAATPRIAVPPGGSERCPEVPMSSRTIVPAMLIVLLGATIAFAQGDEDAGDLHEDAGYLSLDTDHSSLLFRQFLSEGFVNTFDVPVEDADTLRIRFGPRDSERAGGMRVRMELVFPSDAECEMVHGLAAPGKDFAACQRMRMMRSD
jgi:hypothetical protein